MTQSVCVCVSVRGFLPLRCSLSHVDASVYELQGNELRTRCMSESVCVCMCVRATEEKETPAHPAITLFS